MSPRWTASRSASGFVATPTKPMGIIMLTAKTCPPPRSSGSRGRRRIHDQAVRSVEMVARLKSALRRTRDDASDQPADAQLPATSRSRRGARRAGRRTSSLDVHRLDNFKAFNDHTGPPRRRSHQAPRAAARGRPSPRRRGRGLPRTVGGDDFVAIARRAGGARPRADECWYQDVVDLYDSEAGARVTSRSPTPQRHCTASLSHRLDRIATTRRADRNHWRPRRSRPR